MVSLIGSLCSDVRNQFLLVLLPGHQSWSKPITAALQASLSFLNLTFHHSSVHPHALHLHNMNVSIFRPCCCFVLTYCLRRGPVAVHCGRVPVHPPAGHRGHPHVSGSVSLRQRHWWSEAQRFCCHFHRAFRWEASWLSGIYQPLTSMQDLRFSGSTK